MKNKMRMGSENINVNIRTPPEEPILRRIHPCHCKHLDPYSAAGQTRRGDPAKVDGQWLPLAWARASIISAGIMQPKRVWRDDRGGVSNGYNDCGLFLVAVKGVPHWGGNGRTGRTQRTGMTRPRWGMMRSEMFKLEARDVERVLKVRDVLGGDVDVVERALHIHDGHGPVEEDDLPALAQVAVAWRRKSGVSTQGRLVSTWRRSRRFAQTVEWWWIIAFNGLHLNFSGYLIRSSVFMLEVVNEVNFFLHWVHWIALEICWNPTCIEHRLNAGAVQFSGDDWMRQPTTEIHCVYLLQSRNYGQYIVGNVVLNMFRYSNSANNSRQIPNSAKKVDYNKLHTSFKGILRTREASKADKSGTVSVGTEKPFHSRDGRVLRAVLQREKSSTAWDGYPCHGCCGTVTTATGGSPTRAGKESK
ncbi:hypothetical protein C8J57DRAFT_1231371 [Mycena rebaudengoi]|nr:hypothetical protein C8J57DRAFT_1231371 [Mycena rebaudengoi]